MQDIKSGTFGKMAQAERWEGLQFGTVSDILTVSSSWQSDNEHIEAEQVEAEKVGVSIKRVLCNDFQPVKVKKIYFGESMEDCGEVQTRQK